LLIRPGDDGIAADADQCANLTVTFEQDLFGERRGGESGGAVDEVSHAEFLAEAPAAPGRQGLGGRGRVRHEDSGVGQLLALSTPVTAQRIETQDQILGQRAPATHVWTGPGRGSRPGTRGKQSRGFDQVRRGNTRAFGGVLGIETAHDL